MKSILSFLSIILTVQFVGFFAKADMRLMELYRHNAMMKQLDKKISIQRLSPEIRGFVQPETESLTFDQKLDQDNPSDTRTFKQRYYINSQYASQPTDKAPVIYFICGEGACSPNEATATMGVHAQKLGAHIISVEHRYYGQSLPFTQLSTANLKYLSTDYALKDLATIQKYLMTKGYGGKWIAVGGSYSGSLSAYYREKYPNLVVGALASSAPVQARANFEDYDLYVSQVAGAECGGKMKEVTAQIEAVLDKPDELAAIQKKFSAEALTNKVDFLYLVADIGAFAIQYGMRDQFCGMITKGSNALDMYAQFANYVYMAADMTALSDSVQGAMDENVDPNASVGNRQWFYQSCTEYGYWQVAYHDPKISVRSSKIDLAYHKAACQRLFKLDIAGNEAVMNPKFYAPLLDASQVTNILFTNGAQDPWSKLSITPANGNNKNKNVTEFVIDGAAHCDDLVKSSSTSPSIAKAQSLFETLAVGWLN